MLLYHGTSERVAKLALTQGLMPRDYSEANGNWDHTVPSRSDLVYITRAYAPYFAAHASQDGERWGIIEIDSEGLCECDLLPDEDFLEQGSRRMKPETFGDLLDPDDYVTLAACKTMEERTSWFRDRLELFSFLWQNSIDKLGNAAHAGVIPASAIPRVSLFNPSSNDFVTMNIDPTITIMNYLLCGGKYRSFTDWFFRFDDQVIRGILDDVEPEPGMPEAMARMLTQRYEHAREELARRDGLEVIENEGYNRS